MYYVLKVFTENCIINNDISHIFSKAAMKKTNTI